MLRWGFTVVFGLLFLLSHGQLKKFYTLKETSKFDVVDFTMEATAGNCFIRSSQTEGPLTIYGNPDLEKINPSFKSEVVDGTCRVHLDLQEFRSSSFSDGIFFAMMRSDKEQNNYWEILFDQSKTYRLDLSYGFGNADVDLSGTSVQNFKIRTGSADVVVDYNDGNANKVEMDTFYVKVDMGSIITRHLELARPKYVNANIGFGKAVLDIHEPMQNACKVKASVGAGNLDIFIPRDEIPMIIRVKESPLCGLTLLNGFEEVERNVYVNMTYSADAENLISFDLDVALGNISFHYVD